MITVPVDKRQIAAMMAAGLFLIVASTVVWWRFVYQDPYNVFWGMLSNSMQTSSVSRHLEQATGQTKLQQTLAIQYGVQNGAQALTKLQQGNLSVSTETIGNDNSEFVRYTAISTGAPASTAAATKQQLKAVQNKWAKNDVQDSTSSNAQLPLFEQATFGLAGGNVIPLVNLTAVQRNDLLHNLQNNVVFEPDYGKMKRTVQNGRPVFVYPVTVQAVAYAGFQKALAEQMGFTLFSDLEPNDYQGQPATGLTVSVDVWSHQLVRVQYTGQDRDETYSDYNVQRTVSLPKAAISGAQLQKLVQAIE